MLIASFSVHHEHDVVSVRQCARQIAGLLLFPMQDQTRIATAVSEIARNAVQFAAAGIVEFVIEQSASKPVLAIVVTDRGKGISSRILKERLADSAASRPPSGLTGAKRLMDGFDIDSTPANGTRVVLKKNLPVTTGVDETLPAKVAQALAQQPMASSHAEMQWQNKELLRTLAELRIRQDELLTLTQALEDTNRGIVALNAEIEEKADYLRHADEMKSRLLSNTSHELRTPLNSIRALARLLLDRLDGDLTPEQDKQVSFIEQAATELGDLVNDLLDLAKMEAGRVNLVIEDFGVNGLMRMLRGMLRPLKTADTVDLIFEELPEECMLRTDEGKVAQILRNLVSNALKFTTQGEVRIGVSVSGDWVRFSVSDTGIGIAPEQIDLVFEEFSQIENALQKNVKGTGLGLPLCVKLAGVLGGSIEVSSQPNVGSVFAVVLPITFTTTRALPEVALPFRHKPLTGNGQE